MKTINFIKSLVKKSKASESAAGYNAFDYTPFSCWLDSILEKPLPDGTVAINFNLYDDGDSHWSMELVASSSFDSEDDDWACEELFATRENPFKWKDDCDFNKTQNFAEEILRRYLAEGKCKDKLMQYKAIGVGFVDGDISLIHKK